MTKISTAFITDNARHSLLALAEAQRLYSDDTANPIMENHPEIELSLNPDSIPNPATFAIRFGERLTKHNFSGMHIRVYSDYPFKHRLKTGGIKDNFERKAIQYLRNNSQEKGEDTEFTSIENYKDQIALRMATPIIMKRSCVLCHNTHPNSTKRDWKIGDVRGIRSVAIPTQHYYDKALQTIIPSSMVILTSAILLLVVIWFIIKALQKSAQKEQQLAKKTVELNATLLKQNKAISRFVPDQIHTILGKENITEIDLGNAKKLWATILFSDIRSFSTIAERLQDEELFTLLNDYIKHMETSIRANHGFIDKYIGDAIMAIFPRRADDAIHTAIGMRNALHSFNKNTTQQFSLDNGIGIHTGYCILGTVGVQERMEGTVIGDSVNISARVEALTTELKHPIIITGTTLQALESPQLFKIKSLGSTKVKGKEQAIHIHAVEGLANPD